MNGKLSPKQAIYLLTTAPGREFISSALKRPHSLGDDELTDLHTALEYPIDEIKARDFGRALLLSYPQYVGLDNILTKLFLHSGLDLSKPRSGAQVIEKSFEKIAASDADEFFKRIKAHRNVIEFVIRFSGIEELRAQFLYHMNILARKLFDEETKGLSKGKSRFELSRDDFERMITKLYAVNSLESGEMSVYDLSRLLPYEFDTVSNRYKFLREFNTIFYAYGPKAAQLVKEIARLDPNNRLVVLGPDKKKGGGQSSGGGGSSQAPDGSGELVQFPGIVRHADHALDESAKVMHGHSHADDAKIAAQAATTQSASAMISAGLVVPLKLVR